MNETVFMNDDDETRLKSPQDTFATKPGKTNQSMRRGPHGPHAQGLEPNGAAE